MCTYATSTLHMRMLVVETMSMKCTAQQSMVLNRRGAPGTAGWAAAA